MLMRHSRTHDKLFACTDYEKKFSTHQLLKLHQMQQRHGIYAATPPGKSFDCNECDRKYSSEIYLKHHKRKMHKIEEAKCKVCDKICRNRYSLYQHSQAHAKVECSICAEMVFKNQLVHHMRSHSAKSLACDHCGYSTNFKSDLKRHIERIHLLKKLFKDPKDREDFSDFALLEKLQLKYNAPTTCEKNFHCVKCGKPHATRSVLNHHLRQVHPVKLLDCSICKKSFKTKGHLKALTRPEFIQKHIKKVQQY